MLSETPCTPQARAWQLLRRWHKPLLALLLLLAYLPLRDAVVDYQAAHGPAVDLRDTAAAISAQFLNLWGPLSKLVLAIVFYYAGSFISFKGLATAPVLTDWATGRYGSPDVLPRPVSDYKAAFLALTDAERLAHHQKAEWKEMIRWGLSLMAACVIV